MICFLIIKPSPLDPGWPSPIPEAAGPSPVLKPKSKLIVVLLSFSSISVFGLVLRFLLRNMC